MKQTLMNAAQIPVKMEQHVMMTSMNTVVIVLLDSQEFIVKQTLMNAALIPVNMRATCQDEVNQYSCLCAGGYTGNSL